MTHIGELLVDVDGTLAQHQPELKSSLLPHGISIDGTFVCTSDAGPFDRFEIKIELSELFPDQEPRLTETGGRIPATLKRHIFSSGSCCLGLWEAWLLKTPTPDFEAYLLGPVTSYFVSQSIFEQTGEWPFGEQGHSADDIVATYADALGLPSDADRAAYLRLLTQPLLGGNPVCPCGSGKRLRECHWNDIRDSRRKVPASVRNSMARRLRKLSKD